MRHIRRVRTMACILVAVTLLVTLLGGNAFAASADLSQQIVMFVDGTPLADQQQVAALSGSTVLYNLSLITALAVLTNDQGLAILKSKVQGVCNPSLDLLCVVAGVFDDVQTFIDPICPTTTAPPRPPEYRWGMVQIRADDAHDNLWPDPSETNPVTVALLDTGIASHTELVGRIAPGHGHGTHMAGIILANKGSGGVVGVAGVEPGAPKIKVAAVKVLYDDGSGDLSAVINGLQWVYDQLVRNPRSIRLVNMSFGFRSRETEDRPLREAIQKLSQVSQDIIMVASAGNACCVGGACDDSGGDDCGPARNCTLSPQAAITAPAAYPEVLAVGATNINGQAASYSLSRGHGLDVMAPGGELNDRDPDKGQILSTNNVGWGQGHGTSQAAAAVAGGVALALSLEPALTRPEVMNLVSQTAVASTGQIDVWNMIDALLP
jgi:subtilisin family serine protease